MTGQGPDPVMRVFLVLYAVLWCLLLPVIFIYLWRRGRKDADYSKHIPERFASYPDGPKAQVWIHAVSLGELRSAVPLIRALLDRGERVVCTHFTPAGRREAHKVFAADIARGDVQSVWVPFEFAWCWRRFFRRFQPKVGLVMEIEIWPRMIFSARSAGVPLMMCNAQYPSKSMVRDAKWVGLGLRHRMMRGFAGALVKSPLQARRFQSVGVQGIDVTGELRFDQPIAPHLIERGKAARAALAQGRGVITLASAIEGEDALYIRALRAVFEASETPPLVIYVPRAPERFAAVGAMLRDAGFDVAERSAMFDETLGLTQPSTPEVLLGDSLGEMYFYLTIADKVVTGGGFHPKGAHNIIEPLALQKPVIVGPYTHTIEYPFTEAEAAGVCHKAVSEAELIAALQSWTGPDQDQIIQFFNDHSGGTERTVQAIAPYLTPSDQP